MKVRMLHRPLSRLKVRGPGHSSDPRSPALLGDRPPFPREGVTSHEGIRPSKHGEPIAGNHVVIASSPTGLYTLLAHLRRGSATVVEDHVQPSDSMGSCGNSGNSTQPYLHIQATDSTNWYEAKGLPITFDHPNPRDAPREPEIVTV